MGRQCSAVTWRLSVVASLIVVILCHAPGGTWANPTSSPASSSRGELLQLLALRRGCSDPALASSLERVAQRRGPLVSGLRARRAVALGRARLALARSRQLFVQSNFGGCASLLAIIEGELGGNVADARGGSQRAHRLLAEVNLWLGVCQWSAGQKRRAAASFLRSAQLPSAPLPDRRLFPPALLRAYRRAVRAPRRQIACRVEAPLAVDALLVDGKGPLVREGGIALASGTHYVVVGACDPASARCAALRRQLPSGPRALRVSARHDKRCVLRLPASRGAVATTRCVSAAEAIDPRFVGAVLEEAGERVALAVVASVGPRRFVLGLMPRGKETFSRQLSGALTAGEDVSAALARALGLLLAVDARPVTAAAVTPEGSPPRPREAVRDQPWYRRWWVWAIVGAVTAAATATAVALSSRSGSVRVVFGP